MDTITVDWTQVGVGVGALVAMIYIVKTMRSMMSEMLKFMYNHHSDITRALDAVADRMETMNENFTRLTENFEEQNDLFEEANDRRSQGYNR